MVLIFTALAVGIGGLLLGAVVGYFLKRRFLNSGVRAAEVAAQQLLERAGTQRNQLLLKAKQDALELGVNVERMREHRDKNHRQHKDLARAMRKNEERSKALGNRERTLDQRVAALTEQSNREKAALKRELEQTQTARKKYVSEIERVAGLTEQEARKQVMDETESAIKGEVAQLYRRSEKEAREIAEKEAQEVLVHAIQRMAAGVVVEATVTNVELPNEDMKGRLIGREGRNIKALEAATGVDFIVDNEDPTQVTLSSFNPLRREVARLALRSLLKDGRIQPERIERMVAKAEKDVKAETRKAGEAAMYEAGVRSMSAELQETMGGLKYRQSFGSNVLRHSVEVGLLAGAIAAEVGGNVETCRVAGFLHDIGKAFTPEIDKPHAEIGADLVKDRGFGDTIQKAIREHHDSEFTTVPSFIVAAADAISAARPGVRKDTKEKFIKRMEELEALALGFDGVEKCYALQSGHQVRVLVNPNGVNDEQTALLARDIANRIKTNITLPGEINVQVIRELRAEAKVS